MSFVEDWHTGGRFCCSPPSRGLHSSHAALLLRELLLSLLKDRAFSRDSVVLSSGETSDYYIDSKMVTVCSEGAYLIGEVIYDYTKGVDFNAIGGPGTGAIPLVTSAVISYRGHCRGKDLEGFWFRGDLKPHGTQKAIEGKLPANARVLIVDDVVTSGRSVIKAIQPIEKAGAEIVMVLAMVDRLRGAGAEFERRGYGYQTIFTSRDFGVDVP